MRKTLRAIAETCVQGGELEPLDKFENRRGALADEREDVKQECEEGDGEAEKKRDAMAPPGLQKLVEAKCAPPLPDCY